MMTRLALGASILGFLGVFAGCSSSGSDPSGGTTPETGGSPTPGSTPTGTATPTPSATTPPSTTPPTTEPTGTWADGKQITANVDIGAGSVVTIAPGATITVAPGVSITVHGTLTAAAKSSHAKLVTAAGSTWAGIIVESGGTLSLSGVDLTDTTGIDVKGGDTAAAYDYGTITGGAFTVETGGKLTTDHAAVAMGGGTSIAGAFTATFLDYTGSNLSLNDASATVSIADSKFTGGGTGTDFLTSEAGALLTVEYSTITNSHCPFHFDTLTKYSFDHVATRGNGFGLMLYNEDVGPNTISYSSFEDTQFDQTGKIDKIAIDHSYIKSKSTVGAVTISTAASGPVTAAAPRGTPGPGLIAFV